MKLREEMSVLKKELNESQEEGEKRDLELRRAHSKIAQLSESSTVLKQRMADLQTKMEKEMMR